PGRVCDPAGPEARPCGAGPAGAYAPSPPTVAVRREVQHRRRYRDGARAGPGGSPGGPDRTVRRLHFRGEGYLREAGNVLFHFALLALLLALAAGAFFGYRGNMLLVEGDGFANTLPSYDAIYPGHWTNTDRLEPFTIHLDDFEASFIEEGDLRGQPASYVADITYKDSPEAEEQQHRLEVNHPLDVGGVQVYLLGHGYAPEFEVRNPEGDVVFDQAVPFLFRDTAS